jgi:hypothetical protein
VLRIMTAIFCAAYFRMTAIFVLRIMTAIFVLRIMTAIIVLRISG